MASPLEVVAAKISAEVATVTRLLQECGAPAPSFAESSAVVVGTNTKPANEAALLKARNELINAAHDLLRLAQGPVDHLVTLAYAAVDTANLATVVRFEIPQKVPFGSTISLADLATATGLDENVLTRTVRYAITNGIFIEPEPGQIAHTAASATLAKNKSLHDMTVFNSGFSTRIVVSLADALKMQGQPNAPEAAFNVSYPGYVNLFDYMAKNPEASQGYFNYLDGRGKLPRYAVDNVVRSWDWESVASGIIVDVGGASGYNSIALARHLPRAKFYVEDINVEGLKMGRETVAQDPDLQQRITFTEHDFFEPQPVQADVYFFRHVLHDWSDADCVRILRALLPALKDGARVLVSEGVMPEPPATRSALLEDKQVRIDDHVMLAAHVARERSVEEYTKLFEIADDGFSFVAVHNKPGVHNSLIEYKFTKQ
ncbi:hypothetical protein VTN77DRAFT_389 [Rasamsonia byssochlamydoides]|uniref:uncharacterized protein n=1 Tax=Rasamsonia byssochlamydoides TaxID=89139 RepID=UPI003744A3F7